MTGTFTIEADLVSVENDVVVPLRTSDNKEIRIPLTKISKADQDFVKKQPAPSRDAKPVAGDGASTSPKLLFSKQQIQQAEVTVNDLFKDDITKARTPQQEVALIEKLLTTAKAEQEQATRYALLKKAAELRFTLARRRCYWIP